MITDAQKLVDHYVTWLRDKTSLRQLGEWVEMTTPYLDRHNDYLQIYLRRSNGGYLLTDDGYILEDLEHCGCSLESEKRQSLLSMTLNGFGVHLVDRRLEVTATSDNFPLRKHNLIQAMLAVNDLFALASPAVASFFLEDVMAWLDEHDIRYTPKVKFTGKSGFDHMFDFVIPKSRTNPERILRVVNHPSRDAAQSIAFSWIDTKHVRSPDSQAYAILNDAEQRITAAVLEALLNYDVRPLPWKQRESVERELAA